MDRNGKKAMATTTSVNSERSDVKAKARSPLGVLGGDPRSQPAQSADKARSASAKGWQKGRTP